MRLSRRRFFEATVATYVTTSVASAAPSSGSREFLSRQQMATFSAFVDTLIPADRHSPAASTLDVPSRILELNAQKPNYIKLVRLGCRWLDGRARAAGTSAFFALDDGRREMIVTQAARPTAERLPHAFFRVIRQGAMKAYYSRADSWGGLRYDGPPQPDGFPDYAQPPKTRAR